MSAARTRLDIAAENLSNSSTNGFRKSDASGFLTAAGVTIRRVRDSAQGALRRTGRTFDLAIVGNGAFRVRDARGHVTATRDGAFMRDRFGRLTDALGRVLLGTRGALRVPEDAHIAGNGSIVRNGVSVDRIPLERGASVRSGFLETSNVDGIGEMIDVLQAQRSFESAQKVLSSIDQTRERASSQVAKIQ